MDVRHAAAKWRITNFETLSCEDACPVNVYELASGEGQRVGWSFVFMTRTGDGIPVGTIYVYIGRRSLSASQPRTIR
jgi:hypothetical protein